MIRYFWSEMLGEPSKEDIRMIERDGLFLQRQEIAIQLLLPLMTKDGKKDALLS